MKITYYGHSCFEVVVNGKKLLFDPFISHNPLAKHIDISSIKPDFVLVSHGHSDHIDDCVKISRHIEFSLDRESEDFDLQVSSPGADAPFKVRDQYKKYEGKNVEVITTENKVINGRIIASDETKFELEMKLASKGNKKIATTEIVQFNYNQIKQTKATISFKYKLITMERINLI